MKNGLLSTFKPHFLLINLNSAQIRRATYPQ